MSKVKAVVRFIGWFVSITLSVQLLAALLDASLSRLNLWLVASVGLAVATTMAVRDRQRV